jgi:hypothetical protein
MSLTIYSVTGGHVMTLVDRVDCPTGINTFFWSALNGAGRRVRNGVYFCIVRNETTGEEGTIKIAVVR